MKVPVNLFPATARLVVLLLSLSSFIDPQLNPVSLKSLFIYNFTKHVDWPENGAQYISIGIVNDQRLTEKLQQVLKNKKVKEKSFEVLPVQTPDDAKFCQLIFIPAEHGYQIKNFVKTFEGKAVLIVTEGTGMTLKGAAISLIKDNDRLTFEVNENVISRSGLNVSKELIRLGIPVKK
jgi:hypothetical protein